MAVYHFNKKPRKKVAARWCADLAKIQRFGDKAVDFCYDCITGSGKQCQFGRKKCDERDLGKVLRQMWVRKGKQVA